MFKIYIPALTLRLILCPLLTLRKTPTLFPSWSNTTTSAPTQDLTVCHISGNYISAKDEDERIGAHYQGKQYQGWVIVRDKLKELKGKYGDAVRSRGNGGGGGGGGGRYNGNQQQQQQSRGGGGGGGYHNDQRGGYHNDQRRGEGGYNNSSRHGNNNYSRR